jgi:ElaB/YqjD/DUF883 family membrane-anchored ribosome-binding protein
MTNETGGSMNLDKGDNGVAAQLEDGRVWAVDRLAALDKKARWLVSEHPIAALACAVGIGFIAARLLSARRTP